MGGGHLRRLVGVVVDGQLAQEDEVRCVLLGQGGKNFAHLNRGVWNLDPMEERGCPELPPSCPRAERVVLRERAGEPPPRPESLERGWPGRRPWPARCEELPVP